MEVFFFTSAGAGLFVRNDMEEGHWVQEEMTVNAVFPLDPGKLIRYGMRMAFRDPATDNLEVFEIRTVQNAAADGSQQITAEHIVISELTDEHINTTEITDKTPEQALRTVLTGTLWSVGNVSAVNVSSCDISRGTVWQAVSTLCHNWNVYIIPRVTLSGSGSIAGRYLDIMPAQGVFRGIRLSVDKNMTDPIVSYDDTDVLTALYGYGGNVDVAQNNGDDISQELTFAGVTWTAENGHPAKPAGQTYLEWPEKTSLYGRNGRPRFGFYQNGDIKDAATLLQKTWETLQKTTEPKINISGTVTDLHRLGYTDQPIRLHDLAIVEIRQTGEVFRKEIIKNDVDLVNPDQTMLEIGDYIPNIIYISRESYNYATGNGSAGGHSGGSGGSRGKTELETNTAKTYAQWVKLDDRIGMVVGMRNGTSYIKAGEIVLSINEQTGESTALLDAHYVNIGTLQTKRILATATDEYAQVIGTYVWENVLDGNGQPVVDAAGNPVRRVKGLDGSGNLVWKNGAAYGIWDKGELSAGLFVEKEQGGTTYTKIKGSSVQLGDDNTNNVTIKDAFEITSYNGVQTIKLKQPTLVNNNIYVNGGDIKVAPLDGSGGKVEANSHTVTYGGSIVFEARTPSNADPALERSDALGLKDTASHAKIVSNEDGQYELWYLPVTTATTEENATPSTANGWISGGTFSKATSLTPAWSGGATAGAEAFLTITGTPAQNPALNYEIEFGGHAKTLNLYVNHGTPEAYYNDNNVLVEKYLSVPTKIDEYVAPATAGGQPTFTTRYTANGVIDATIAWNQGETSGKTTGWNAARGVSLIPDAQAEGGSIQVKIPSTTYGTPIDRTFELYSETNNQVVLRYNTAQSGQPVYRTVAQITHNQFTAGQNNIINAGGSYSQSGPCTNKALNQYVTTLTVTNAVSAGKVSYDSSYVPSGETAAITAVKPVTSGGYDYLRIWQRVNSLTGSGASAERTVETFAGSSQVDISTITDYGDGYTNGYNAAARSPAGWVDYFGASTAAQSASIANNTRKEDGSALADGQTLAAGWTLGYYYQLANGTKHYVAKWKVPDTAAALIAAGGEESVDSDGDYTLNKYVTTLHVNVGGEECNHYSRGRFYCSITTSQGVSTVTLTRTWNAYSYPSVFSNGDNITVYTT